MNFEGTYVWSKSTGVPSTGYTNPAERELDYSLLSSHRTQEFRANGIFELPFGPGRLLFGNSSSWIAQAIGGWQTGLIFNVATGAPTSVASSVTVGTTTYNTGLYANSVADVVGPFDARKGTTHWGDPIANGQLAGNYFENGTYIKVQDPQCVAAVSTSQSLRSFCGLQAVADATTNQILLQNPAPGKRGTLGRNTIEYPGTWSLDANLAKTFRITESKSLQVRIDATNVFNHPYASNPSLNINSSNAFGYIADKTDNHRQFQGVLRFSF